MNETYEVVVFTASLSVYADPLLDKMDPMGYISHRLFREHCIIHNREILVKDLSKLGRELKNVIIVDNSPNAYLLHKENAIPIVSWIDDTNDKKLLELAPLLEYLAKKDDVRKSIAKIPKSNSIDYVKALKILKGERYIKSHISKTQSNLKNIPWNDLKKSMRLIMTYQMTTIEFFT